MRENMAEEWSTSNHRNNLKSNLVIVIVAISVISVAVWTLSSSWALPSTLINEEQEKPNYTTSYTAIDPKTAYELVFNNSNPLTIVDIRSCDCDYEEGHIPKAIWQTFAPSLYETTSDLLIYCNDGELSVTFCEDLLSHTYGAIYYLDGGIESWIDAGYRVTEL
jgi:rhodanese-related sulfurtransferase